MAANCSAELMVISPGRYGSRAVLMACTQIDIKEEEDMSVPAFTGTIVTDPDGLDKSTESTKLIRIACWKADSWIL